MELFIPELLYIPAVTISIYMLGFFLIAQLIKNNSIIDIGWGPGFILAAIITLLYSDTFQDRQILATSLVVLWGLRLGLHIGTRNIGKSEDFRYKKWREQWGKRLIPRAFFQIFLMQGIFMYIISLGVIVINAYGGSEKLNAVDYIGVSIFLFGFLFEIVGDYQLRMFINKKKHGVVSKNAIMTAGLWKFTRHPNYFGEAILWWGILLIALNVNYGYIALISPLTIDFVLLTISLPMLEKKYKKRKEFQEYTQKTSKFFPLLPKNE